MGGSVGVADGMGDAGGGDNDPQTFFGLILAALHLIDRDLAAGTAALLAAGRALDAEAIVHQLIEDLSATTRSFVLVLDDYHVIEAPEIHQAMDLLLQHLPTTMRLVLDQPHDAAAALGSPPDQRRALTGHARATCSSPRRRRCSTSTTRLGLDLTPSEVGVLHERTEGWVIGLQLVGSALRGRTRDQTVQFVQEFVGSADLGDQYLWEEVLERQPEDVRSFLLRTSVLDRFNAELVRRGDREPALATRCSVAANATTCSSCRWTGTAPGIAITTSSPTPCASG